MSLLQAKKNIFVAFLLILGVVNIDAASSKSAKRRSYTTENPLVFGAVNDLWGYCYVNDYGQPEGYEIDVVKAILDRLEIPYKIITGPTDSIVKGANDNSISLSVGERFVFGDSIHTSSTISSMLTYSVAYVRNHPHISVLNDLKKQKALIDPHSFMMKELKEQGFGGNLIDATDTRKAMIDISKRGDTQLIGNTLVLQWLKKKYNLENIEITLIKSTQGKRRILSNDKPLLNRIDSVYSVMSIEGVFEPMTLKWFYPDFKRSPFPPYFWLILTGILLLSLIIIGVILYYIFWRSKKVALIKQQNVRLTQIMRSGTLKIWLYNVKDRVLRWYDENMTSYSSIPLNNLQNQLPSDDFELLSRAIYKVSNGISAKEVFHQQGINFDGKKDKHNQEVCACVFKSDKNGRPTWLLGIQHETTLEQIQSRECDIAMRQYEMIFNESLADVFYFNPSGVLTMINKHAVTTLHISDVLTLLGRQITLSDMPETNDIYQGMREDFNACLMVDFDKMNEEGHLYQEIERRGAACFELSSVPIYNDDHTLMGFCLRSSEITDSVNSYRRHIRNISQLKEATKQLSDIIAQLNYTLREGGVKLCIYNPTEHKFTIYKAINEVFMEFSEDDMISLITPDYHTALMNFLRQLDHLDPIKVDETFKITRTNEKGQFQYIQISGIPMLDAAGKVKEYFGTYTDVTDMENSKIRLEIKKKEAQKAETATNVFLRNMSYEIRTPLNTVVGFSELFNTVTAEDDRNLFVKEIKQAAGTLLSLINDVLLLSRLDAAMINVELKPCDFHSVCRRYVEEAWNANANEGVKLITDCPQETLTLNIDEKCVGYIIRHIVSNAAKFTRKGTVTVSYQWENGVLRLTVTDTGRGISDDVQDKVFNRFMKVNENDGTGLGLPICRSLSTLLGGTILLSSTLGKGTTVTFTLPCEKTKDA